MSKFVLITGCSGLIGSESVRFMVNKGYNVIGVDNHMRGYFFGPESSTKSTTQILLNQFPESFIFHDIDIRDYKSLEKIFIELSQEIEMIIHTAAQPSHDWASKEPITDFSVNATGTLNLLELTRKYCKNATFIFTSTNKVYGDNPNKIKLYETDFRYNLEDANYKNGIDESMSVDNCVHSLFGVSKLSADLLVQEYGKYYDMNTVCFRGGCLTGPQHASAELHGFLSYLIKCIVNNKHYTIFGYKGKQVRDNIHSYDLVNMFWSFHKNPKKGAVYNAGGGLNNSTSILEAINLVNNMCTHFIPKWNEWNSYTINDKNRIGDHIFYVTDISKFKSDYPDWPGITITLNEIIKEITVKELSKL